MRLRRAADGLPKYSLLRNDQDATELVPEQGVGERNENFPIMLKDEYSLPALMAYAAAAEAAGDLEYAEDVRAMAARSGRHHRHCKRPD